MATTEAVEGHRGSGISSSRLILLTIALASAFSLGRQTITTDHYRNALRASSFDFDDTPPPRNTRDRLYDEDEADSIIRNAYNNSYAYILPCDDNTSGKDCMQKTYDYFNPKSVLDSKSTPAVPWWFQTLLRDILQNGAYGFWHHFTTSDPPLNLCTIEKVGTTEWRKLFCNLNKDECLLPEPNGCLGGIPGRKCKWRTDKEMPVDAPWAVFLRDPLERVLSAFLDKCDKPIMRKREKHCEPNEVFNPDPNRVDDRGKKILPLTADLEDRGKQMFAAYLDVMPLKWNVHFVPMAITCDLHRRIHEFDFVGNMGKEFMVDLERMAGQFGGKLPQALDSTFGYVAKIEENKLNNTGKGNFHATHAPEKVAMYYTAQTVRKALEYVSIDYLTLQLEVPNWARQMLREDTK
jgi:hypothetical protein|eukprot:scaffold1618_cov196-Alexandrium_tamarense.AAC.5